MKIACSTAAMIPATPEANVLYFALYTDAPKHFEGIGSIAPSLVYELKQKGIKPSIGAFDFATLAFSASAADEAIPRHMSADGWTRVIELSVSLINPDPWIHIIPDLENTLRFLSGDYWHLTINGGGVVPIMNYDSKEYNADCICLLSGGTDSLIGAIDLLSDGATPLLVSRIVRGDSEAQRVFANTIGNMDNHCQWSCTFRKPSGLTEQSTRARSLVFIAYAVLASSAIASSNSPTTIVVPENGFISLNVPLDAGRMGSLSTKTTHPVYMEGIQRILDLIGINVRLSLPYQFKTKGEMILECKNQELLQSLIDQSISCGKYRRHALTHCGVCIPCLVRRAAYQKANLEDRTIRGYCTSPQRERLSEDTMAAACAILKYRTSGIHSVSSGTLLFAHPNEKTRFEDVVARGLDEIGALLEQYEVL